MTPADGDQFRVSIEADFVTGTDKLWLAQRRPDGYVSYLTDDGVWRTIAEGVAVDFEPMRFPRGALAAIAEVIKPGPTEAVVSELRATLRVERDRVDRILAARPCGGAE